MITISELTYNPALGRDVEVNHSVEYNPAAYKTHEEAAKGLREALIKYAVNKYGFDQQLAEGEIAVFSPERTKQYSGIEAWCVVWESGPYEWAIGASMQIRGPWGYCEPYYSFDLHFTE